MQRVFIHESDCCWQLRVPSMLPSWSLLKDGKQPPGLLSAQPGSCCRNLIIHTACKVSSDLTYQCIKHKFTWPHLSWFPLKATHTEVRVCTSNNTLMPWLLLALGACYCTVHICSSVWFYFGLEFISKKLEVETVKRYEKSSHYFFSFQSSPSIPFRWKCACRAQLCVIPWI